MRTTPSSRRPSTPCRRAPDAGTFGRRSTPDSGETLRRTAAGARQALIGIAAARLGGPRGHLAAEKGAVVGRLTGQKLPYGTLVAGMRRAEVLTTEPPLSPSAGWGAAGSPHATSRLNAVTGTRFVSDMRLPGLLHGAVLHPPVPGAVPRVVDYGALAAMPGVTIVRDGEFIGVAATDPVTARRAVAGIKADWNEPSPGPVTRVAAAFKTVRLAHVPLEAVAEWDNGRLTVWAGTNVPFAVRARLSNTFRISEAAIRVIVPPAWGGGGGNHGDEAVEAARLSRHAFQPVMVH